MASHGESKKDASMIELSHSLDNLTGLFKSAAQDIQAEPQVQESSVLANKLDKLIEQNAEMARALLLLLELNRGHLPQISKHVKTSADAVSPRGHEPRPAIYQTAGYKLPSEPKPAPDSYPSLPPPPPPPPP